LGGFGQHYFRRQKQIHARSGQGTSLVQSILFSGLNKAKGRNIAILLNCIFRRAGFSYGEPYKYFEELKGGFSRVYNESDTPSVESSMIGKKFQMQVSSANLGMVYLHIYVMT